MRAHVPDPDAFTVDLPTTRLACLAWGEGPPVVLVHGFPDTARTWDRVGPHLASRGFRAVAPFTRGIAPSPVPPDGDYGSDRLGRDVLELIEALGAGPAVVVGHDFGASAVYSAAGLGPERLRGLVAVAIPHPATIRPTLGKLWGVRHFLTHRLPGAAKRFARDDFAQIRVLYERWSPGFPWPDDELEAARNAYAAPGSLDAALAYYRALSPSLPAGQRARLAVPSLIVGGLTDGVATTSDFEASRTRFTGPSTSGCCPGATSSTASTPSRSSPPSTPSSTACRPDDRPGAERPPRHCAPRGSPRQADAAYAPEAHSGVRPTAAEPPGRPHRRGSDPPPPARVGYAPRPGRHPHVVVQRR